MIACRVCGDHAETYMLLHGAKFHLCAAHSKDKSWMEDN